MLFIIKFLAYQNFILGTNCRFLPSAFQEVRKKPTGAKFPTQGIAALGFPDESIQAESSWGVKNKKRQLGDWG